MIIGIDLGGTNVRAAIENDGAIQNFRKEPFNTKVSLDETLTQLKEFIRPLVGNGVRGIGIGVPSVVDVEKGIVLNVTNIPAWKRVPLKDILEAEFKIPVCVNNDVNCFALGEHQFGNLRGMKNVVGVSIGTGLGSGIIINDRLFEGVNCGAGELGLLPYLDQNIEYYASGNLFKVKFNTTAHEANNRAAEGDPQAVEQWEEFGKHVGEAIKCVAYAYDPEAIVLGGSLSKAFRFFNESMHQSMLNFEFPESINRLRVFQSTDDNITVLGAAALVHRLLR
ncbi:MAG TPA: ROK family protein [Chryseolinea sp.]|nr:ROK family protein [Chryseolinea sp.]